MEGGTSIDPEKFVCDHEQKPGYEQSQFRNVSSGGVTCENIDACSIYSGLPVKSF